MGEIVGDQDYGERIDQLAGKGREVIPNPQVSSPGQFFQKVKYVYIDKLRGKIGGHRGGRGPEGESAQFEIQTVWIFRGGQTADRFN